MIRPLTERQAKFVHYYVEDPDRNALQAAARAGYPFPDPQAYRALGSVRVQNAIKHACGELVTPIDVLARLASQGLCDLADFRDLLACETMAEATEELGRLKRRGLSHVVKRITRDRDGRPVIELHDAQAALKMIGSALGLFVERLQIDERLNLDDMSTEELAELRERFARRGRGRPAANGTGLN